MGGAGVFRPSDPDPTKEKYKKIGGKRRLNYYLGNVKKFQIDIFIISGSK